MNIKICEYCGREFEKTETRSRKSWKTARFCSISCASKYSDYKNLKHTEEWKKKHSKRMTGERNPFYGKKHSEEFKDRQRQRGLKRIGAKSTRWQGGITALRKVIKQCFKYRQWRNDVFTRDNWTCQDCGKKAKRIEAHHLKEFAKILRDYKVKTIEDAYDCEKLWDINNGRTLCLDCHELLHIRLKNFKNR